MICIGAVSFDAPARYTRSQQQRVVWTDVGRFRSERPSILSVQYHRHESINLFGWSIGFVPFRSFLKLILLFFGTTVFLPPSLSCSDILYKKKTEMIHIATQPASEQQETGDFAEFKFLYPPFSFTVNCCQKVSPMMARSNYFRTCAVLVLVVKIKFGCYN